MEQPTRAIFPPIPGGGRWAAVSASPVLTLDVARRIKREPSFVGGFRAISTVWPHEGSVDEYLTLTYRRWTARTPHEDAFRCTCLDMPRQPGHFSPIKRMGIPILGYRPSS
ncbi:hypothetical protein BH18CHL1_BH18CHL1_04500 [soil metagenome]